MEADPYKCLLSISTPFKDYCQTPTLAGWMDVISLEFDDVQSLGAVAFIGPSVVRFHTEQAIQLLEFLNKYFGRDMVVHCDAGISRSVAIGCFMRDHLDYELELHGGQNEDDMNKWVYRVLNKHRTRYFMVRPK